MHERERWKKTEEHEDSPGVFETQLSQTALIHSSAQVGAELGGNGPGLKIGASVGTGVPEGGRGLGSGPSIGAVVGVIGATR